MNIPISKQGDLYLLFHHLTYDFEVDLPLPLGPGVCLDRTPQDWLDSTEKGFADYILPGYNIAGLGLNNCCLRCFSRSIPEEKLGPENLIFLSLLSLCLHLPLPINIAGQFRLGDNEERITEPKLYELSSPWSINSYKLYTPSAIAESAAITERLINIERLGCKKLITGVNYFSHVSLGRSNSFQLSHLGLFAALEALFVPSGNKAASLSKRISKFLSNFDFPELMDKWVKDEYINGRHKLAHGIDDATFGTKLRPEKYQAFGRLHEITRLSLLGFLSMESENLIELSKGSGNSLQRMLDNLNTAYGKFLMGQKCWAS
jgi:hypothetical protein